MQTPSLQDFKKQANVLKDYLIETPVLEWNTPVKDSFLDSSILPIFKMELFQRTGSFKARGALTFVMSLSEKERQHGIVAGSGGNHGIAVAYAAKTLGVKATIIVPKTMNAFRLARLQEYEANIICADTIGEVFDKMVDISKQENKAIIHPFEGRSITLGTGTLGLEFLNHVPDLDAVIVAIGGGGLISGVASAIKQAKPNCKIYGVEPRGANSMYLSLQAGKAISIPDGPKSIADSLCSPCAAPYSFSLCQRYVDDVVLVDDDELRQSMKILFEHLKLAVEPACAAALAGLLGPLRKRCEDKKVGVILCGSNIGLESFVKILGC